MAFAALTGSLTLDVDDFEGGVDDAEGELDSLEGRAESVGSSMQRAGGAMTAGLTLPLAGMAAQSARTAAGFEQNMQESIAVMGDVDDAMREDLEQTAQDVASSTTISAEESAEAYYFLASAGMDAAQAMEAMPQVAEFAEAGQMDMAEATDTATNVMSAFGYEADEMTEVTDTLTATVSNHNQTMDGMSSAMSRVAPTASGLGADIEEVSAAIGQLGDVGLRGERAGSALNTVMSQMSDESGPAAQQMEEMGIAVNNSEGEMRPLVDIVRDFEEAGADAGDMAEIFGTRGGPAMSALLEQGSDQLAENTENIDELDGATEDMAETQRESFNAQMQMARNEISNAGIAIGQDLLPYLSVLVNTASGAAEAFGELSSGQQTAIVAIGGLVAIGGPALVMMGMLVSNAVAVAGAFGTMGGAATATGGTLLGVLTPASVAAQGGFTGLAGTIYGALLPSTIAAQGGLTGMAAAALAANVALGPITVPIWAIIAAIGALLAAVVGFAAAYRNNWMNVRDYTEWFIGPILDGIDTFIESIFGISDATGKVADGFGDFLDWILSQINKIPGVDLEGDGFLDFEMPSTEMDDDVADSENLEGIMGEDAEEYLEDGQDYEAAGEEAGQDFGSGLNDGLVESLDTDEIAEEGISQIDTEIEDLESEIETLSSGATSYDEWQQVDDLEEQVSSLKDEREELQNAEEITDFDSELVADVAQSNLEDDREEAEQIESIYDELDDEELDVEVDTDADMASLQEDLDASSDAMDADAVDTMLEGSDSSGDGGEDQLGRAVELLEQLLEAVDALGGPQEIDGTLDLDGWEGDVRGVVQSEKRSDARRNRAQN